MTKKPLLFLGVYFLAISIVKLGFVLIAKVKGANAAKEETR